MIRLPIEDVLPALRDTLAKGPNALLIAPPGAGKTTHVPLALLNEPWVAGKKLLMLEPRRLAARAAAHRMAVTLNESVGTTIGYRMRLDTKVGPATKIEVITEGILTRLLQNDPALEEYAAVLFDEFHERSLQADIGLTLGCETQRLFRPDLRLLVMSATLDCGPVSELLGHAPTIRCDGHMFPVETRYLDHPVTDHLDAAITQIIRRSLAQDHGSLLVFLPGMGEIRRVERRLREANLGQTVHITPLHGDLPQEEQDRALTPAAKGRRKVVLATSIAETSLTIDGIRVVIDAGLLRLPRYDPRSGLTKLDTVRVTRDSADQRRGRAGRLEPGVCYRLWTEREQHQLAPHRPPEMLDADLAPLVLDLARWGTSDPSDLSWLTVPPTGAVAQAKVLLRQLGALNTTGQVTEHGARMADLPLHPRLSHMLLKSVPLRCTELACTLAALLGERDLIRGQTGTRHTDLRTRLDILHGDRDDTVGTSVDRGLAQRVKRNADLWARHVTHTTADSVDLNLTGLLLALAYPDRIAQRHKGIEPRYLLANGRGAFFPYPDPLASEPYLVIAGLDGDSQWSRINLAAPLSLNDIEQLYANQISVTETVSWDERTASVRASRQRRLNALVLSQQALSNPDPALIERALLEGVCRSGVQTLAWTPELEQWRARVHFLRRLDAPGSTWPDLSDETLQRTIENWLGPYVNGMTTLDRVQRLDLDQPLHTLLTWEQQRDLNRLAPTHVTIPSGSQIRIDYAGHDHPVLPVRLQEMFGCQETPRIAGGTVPLTLHLLSPARRPVQVTQDLAGFWAGSYLEVRKQLRGRYPKHQWPENPLTAPPTAKTKRPRQ